MLDWQVIIQISRVKYGGSKIEQLVYPIWWLNFSDSFSSQLLSAYVQSHWVINQYGTAESSNWIQFSEGHCLKYTQLYKLNRGGYNWYHYGPPQFFHSLGKTHQRVKN